MRKPAVALALVMVGGIAAWAAVTLTIAFGSPNVDCTINGATVTLDYTIGSTDASPSAVVETLRDSSNVTKKANSYNIAGSNVPGGWIVAGRIKTFDATFQATGLADGDYSLEVCVTQAGSGGNADKKVCQTKTITVNCGQVVVNPCANTAPFGEVLGNKHISDNSTAQIQFEGDFGPTAHLEITDANGAYVGSADINRNGDSCTYHANWKFTNGSGADIYGNFGPGVYTLKVTGNGKTLEFSTTLN
jgi:hypothetical protein